jgi:hypothetical protein
VARRLALLAWGLALVPLVVAAGRALHGGWVPVGDSALITIRARDVLGGGPGGDMPLLGMWASTSWSVGFDMNHPGPLLYLVLAVPAALVGGGGGVVVGTAAINVASVTGVFVVARRVGGEAVAAAAMAVTAVLCWSFGSAVLVEPWHASTVLLPFACVGVLTWGVLAGDRWCLPWAVAVGSLVLQTNLSYAVLVPALLAVAMVPVVRAAVRPGDGRGGAIRVLGVAAAVGALCWVPVVIEQLTADDGGNLSRLRRSLGVSTTTLDAGEGLGALARVIGLPPWWGRPSYADAFPLGAFGNPLPSPAVAVAALTVVVGLGALALVDARRRGDRVAVGALTVAGVVLAAAYVTALRTPTGPFGTIAYQLRWLWPVGALAALALVVAAVRHPWAAGVRWPWAPVAVTAVTALAAGANLPASHQDTTAPAAAYPVARTVTGAVGAAELSGPVQVVCGEGVFDPYCEAVMARLQDDGVAFVVDEAIGVRQLGNGRRADPGRPLDTLVVVAGDYAVFAPPGARTVTRHEGLDRDEALELFYLRADLVRAIADGDVRLNARGERIARRDGLASVAAEGPARIDAAAATEPRPDLFGTHRRDLVAMVHQDLVDADDSWQASLDRYVDLQDRWDDETVAVYLVPAGG